MDSSNPLVDKIKSIEVFKMSEVLLRDEFPSSSIRVKEESLFPTDLQSIFLKELRREDQ